MYHRSMTQVSKYPVQKTIYDYIATIFFQTIVSLSDRKKVEEFITDFLTPTERIMLIKRLAIYILLGKGYSYQQICTILHVSPSTVAGASRYYKYLGKGSKDVVSRIIKAEAFESFWLAVGEVISGEFARSRKGSGLWKYLHKEIKKHKKAL